MATTTRLGMNKPANSDVVDVTTALDSQYTALDQATVVETVTTTTDLNFLTLYTGKLAYVFDTRRVMRYSGSVWVQVYDHFSGRGRLGFTQTSANSATIAANAETKLMSLTFNVYSDRSYAFHGGGPIQTQAGNNAPCTLMVRWALGGTVDSTGTNIGQQGADVNDNAIAGNQFVHCNYFLQWSPGITGQITAGLFLARPNNADGKTARMGASYQFFCVEDIGGAV